MISNVTASASGTPAAGLDRRRVLAQRLAVERGGQPLVAERLEPAAQVGGAR